MRGVDTLEVAPYWRIWTLPGTIANLGTYTDESVGRRIFTWDTVNSLARDDLWLTGVRVIQSWDVPTTGNRVPPTTGLGPVPRATPG